MTDWEPALKVSLHTHTTVSDGRHSIREVADIARESGVDAVFITDHSDMEWRYYLGVRVRRPSVLAYGPARYVTEIEEVARENPDLILSHGIEASPFYYWTGWPFAPRCHGYTKHLLVLGLRTAEDYERLPLITNERSRFDQFHGPQGIQPYQDLIDYVRERSGLVFWSHPEGAEPIYYATAKMVREPYQQDLLSSTGYAGFGALAEGYAVTCQPGGYWDRALLEYCRGERDHPVWAIGESDFEGTETVLHTPTTMVLAAERSPAAILEAVAAGRAYALSAPTTEALHLCEFTMADGNSCATLGDTLTTAAPAVNVRVNVHCEGTLAKAAIVRNGEVLREGQDACFELGDELPAEPSVSYYRLDVADEEGNQIVSNPVFVKRPADPILIGPLVA